MKTTIQKQGDALVAVFEGRLDTAATPQCEQDLKPLDACAEQNIVLDCSGLEYISSSGLRLFLSVLKTVKPKGCRVFVKDMNEDLRSVFRMTGFTNLFEFL